MHIVTIAFQINPAGQPRVILVAQHLHLERKCEIIRNIFIRKRINVPEPSRSGQSVEKHEARHFFAADLRNEPRSFCHFVPVQVDHHLNRRVFLQNRFQRRKGIGIGIIPFFHVILSHMMHHVIAILFAKNFRQHLPDAHNSGLRVSRNRIGKGFLRMGMINQNLRLVVRPLLYGKHPAKQRLLIQLRLVRRGCRIDRIKFPHQRIITRKLRPVVGTLLLRKRGCKIADAGAICCVAGFVLTIARSGFDPAAALSFAVGCSTAPIGFAAVRHAVLSAFSSARLLIFQPRKLFKR